MGLTLVSYLCGAGAGGSRNCGCSDGGRRNCGGDGGSIRAGVGPISRGKRRVTHSLPEGKEMKNGRGRVSEEKKWDGFEMKMKEGEGGGGGGWFK